MAMMNFDETAKSGDVSPPSQLVRDLQSEYDRMDHTASLYSLSMYGCDAEPTHREEVDEPKSDKTNENDKLAKSEALNKSTPNCASTKQFQTEFHKKSSTSKVRRAYSTGNETVNSPLNETYPEKDGREKDHKIHRKHSSTQGGTLDAVYMQHKRSKETSKHRHSADGAIYKKTEKRRQEMSKTAPERMLSEIYSERNDSRGRNAPTDVKEIGKSVSICNHCRHAGITKEELKTIKTICKHCEHTTCFHCLEKSQVKIKTSKKDKKRSTLLINTRESEKMSNSNEKCSKHLHRNIKCFCADHKTLCCTVCKTTDHVDCRLIELDDLLIQIPDIGKMKQESSDTCRQELTSLCVNHKTLQKKSIHADKEKADIIEEVRSKSLAMIERIKTLEEQFIKQVNEEFEQEKTKLHEETNECGKYIGVITKDIQYLSEPKCVQESKLKTIERVKQIQARKPPKLIEGYVTSIDTEERKGMKYNLNSGLFNTVLNAKYIGEVISEVDEDTHYSSTTVTELGSCTTEDDIDDARYRIVENEMIPGWTEGDVSSNTTFTAIVLLDDGSILLSDQKNRKLKRFDCNFNFKASIEVSSEPWGIARVSQTKYIVTLPMNYSYQEVDVTDGILMSNPRTHLGIEANCVLLIGKQLLFTGFDDDKPVFLVTNLDGNAKQSFLSEDQLKLFKRPSDVKQSSDPNVVLISDADKGIFGLGIEKKDILFHYTDKTLKCSMGIALDDDGRIFICSQQTHSLHCISTGGQYLFTVAMEKIQDMRKPQCICYLPHLDSFIMSFGNNYSLTKFKIKF